MSGLKLAVLRLERAACVSTCARSIGCMCVFEESVVWSSGQVKTGNFFFRLSQPWSSLPQSRISAKPECAGEKSGAVGFTDTLPDAATWSRLCTRCFQLVVPLSQCCQTTGGNCVQAGTTQHKDDEQGLQRAQPHSCLRAVALESGRDAEKLRAVRGVSRERIRGSRCRRLGRAMSQANMSLRLR